MSQVRLVSQCANLARMLFSIRIRLSR
jgi:hypothetical protein